MKQFKGENKSQKNIDILIYLEVHIKFINRQNSSVLFRMHTWGSMRAVTWMGWGDKERHMAQSCSVTPISGYFLTWVLVIPVLVL